jgi:uncharacterized protein (DUF1697 family)
MRVRAMGSPPRRTGPETAMLRAMPAYAAFLRAVNVGGTGKLPMTTLRTLCEQAGFENVTTYIASGNVVFTSKLDAAKAQQKLEKLLAAKMGKPVRAHLRTAEELEAIIRRNPFKSAPANRLIVFFLDDAAPKSALAEVVIPGREEIRASGREMFVFYPDGQGQSKLKVPFASVTTGRNLNSVTKMLELTRATGASRLPSASRAGPP